MLLSVSTTHQPATDLGYLLHKNPQRVHSARLAFGTAILFFPEANDEVCTAVLAIDVDAVGLVRGSGENARWDQYVNDRCYAASSFLSSAMTELLSTAMGGRSKERPELVMDAIPLRIRIPVVRVKEGPDLVRRLFEPLGYEIAIETIPGDSTDYLSLELRIQGILHQVLRQVYVLIPVMDDDKHYWVKRDEVDKLVSRASDWLPNHPEKELITLRFLRHERALTYEALARLIAADDSDDSEQSLVESEAELVVTPKTTVHTLRLEAVRDALRELGARRILDLGCGEGRLLRLLMREPSFEEIVGLDVSIRALERARRTLNMDRLSDRQMSRLTLKHGSLTYRDRTLEGYDAAALVEVVEHLDLARLGALERVVFEFARPRAVIVTTPNREYNATFESTGNEPRAFRHEDHRFEWTRAEFATWCDSVSSRFGYAYEVRPIGPEHPEYGAISQMGVFRR